MAKKEIGIKINLEGDKQFKQSLSEIGTRMKTLGSEMKVVDAQFGKNNKSTEALTAKNEVLGKQINLQKEKIEELKKALQNSVEAYGENDKRTQQWQQKLNDATATLIKMEKELGENEQALKEDAKSFDKAENEADQFGDEIKKTAKETSSASEKFEKLGDVVGKIGKALGAGMAAIGTAAVSAGKELVSMANETAEAGDTIDKESQKMQISAEAYQELSHAADLSGTSMETLKRAQKSLQSAGSDLSIVDALKECASSSDVAAAATEMFGAKTAQELLPMLNQGADGIDSMMQSAKDLGLVMSDEAVAASAKYQDSLSTLQSTFSAVKNNLVSEMLPGITSVMDGLTGILTGDESAPELLKKGADDIVTSLSDMMPKVADILMTLVGAIAEVAPSIITSLIEGIMDNLPSLIDSASEIIIEFTQALIDALPQLADGAVQLITTLGTGLIENLPALVEAAIQVVITLAEGIADALPELIPTIVDCIILIVETLIDNVDELVDAAIEIIIALAEGLIKSLPKLLARLPEIITKVVSTLISLAPKLLSIGPKLMGQLASGIWSNLSKVLDTVKNIGKNIVSGIWTGISNSFTWIKNKISGWVGNVLNFIKNLFGIHSPSTVMRDQVGKFLAMGLGEGFTSEMKNIEEDMGKAIPTSFDFDAKLNVSKPSELGRASGGINLSVNLSIGEFINNREQDVNQLADELSVVLASRINRKAVAF